MLPLAFFCPVGVELLEDAHRLKGVPWKGLRQNDIRLVDAKEKIIIDAGLPTDDFAQLGLARVH